MRICHGPAALSLGAVLSVYAGTALTADNEARRSPGRAASSAQWTEILAVAEQLSELRKAERFGDRDLEHQDAQPEAHRPQTNLRTIKLGP